MLRENNWKVAFPEQNFATVDHIVPTDNQNRPFKDILAEKMMAALENNVREFGIQMFSIGDKNQGIVHVIGPETGLTQPGMTIACGDSHTSTHGAFGSLAFGIGTSQVRDVLVTQCLAMTKPKVRKINIKGTLQKGVYAKDIILTLIRKLGVNGGIGYANEYAGETVSRMTMEERMTICNMSIEGGAVIGYVNPDQKTFDYIKEREFAPKNFEKAGIYWKSVASDQNAQYDDVFQLDVTKLEPVVTWGVNPGQSIGISEKMPLIRGIPENEKESAKLAYKHMGCNPEQKFRGQR